jgi:hypothetical protein
MNGLQQFQMESCQPIKRLKDKKKLSVLISIIIQKSNNETNIFPYTECEEAVMSIIVSKLYLFHYFFWEYRISIYAPFFLNTISA